MYVLLGQILLCCVLPNGPERDGDSQVWRIGRVVPTCTLAIAGPEDQPADVPSSWPILYPGKGERSVETEDRPGKRFRRCFTANRLPLASRRSILVEWHTPVPVPMIVQGRGIRLQI